MADGIMADEVGGGVGRLSTALSFACLIWSQR